MKSPRAMRGGLQHGYLIRKVLCMAARRELSGWISNLETTAPLLMLKLNTTYLNPFKRKKYSQMQTLLDNQTKAITKLTPLKVGALFKRPGTGKSRTAVEIIRSAPVDYVLWLAPYRSVNPLVEGTGIKTEVAKWGGFDCETEFFGIESLSSSDRLYLKLRDKLSKRKAFIVCDESLKIKNEDAIRTKRIIELGQMAEYKLILNGTPISRNLLDIWAQMQFLSPLILNMSFAEFKNTFCEYIKVTKRFNGYRTYTKEFIKQYHNIDHLYSLIRHYVYEADLQLLVKQQHLEANYTIGDEELQEYQRLKSKYLDNEKMMFLNNNIFLEMTMKMQGVYSATEEKFAATENIIKAHGQENCIIYTKYVEPRERLRKMFPHTPVLSLQSDSMSLNLQSRYVTIEFDKTWNWADVDQYQFRTYRQGQEHDCLYYKLTGNVGLEKLIAENNERKMNQLQYFKKITKEELKEVL